MNFIVCLSGLYFQAVGNRNLYHHLFHICFFHQVALFMCSLIRADSFVSVSPFRTRRPFFRLILCVLSLSVLVSLMKTKRNATVPFYPLLLYSCFRLRFYSLVLLLWLSFFLFRILRSPLSALSRLFPFRLLPL